VAESFRREFVVYLSSTLADLGPERDAALAAIAEFGVVRTSFRASDEGVVKTCVEDVRGANLYVGILGQRYGYVPPAEENNPDGKSITELEYEACERPGQPKIPRLMFIKPTEAEGGIPARFIDAISNKPTAERMETFLARAARDQTAYQFSNLADLRAEVRMRVGDKSREFHAEAATGRPTFGGQKPWAHELKPVAVGVVPGTDQAQFEAFRGFGANRFRPFELSPDAPDYLDVLERGIRDAQLGCLLVSPASLSRLGTGTAADKVAAAIALLRLRTGAAVIVGDGVVRERLPEAWAEAIVEELPAGRLSADTGAVLDRLYEGLRGKIPFLAGETCLALPYLVIAPTAEEAQELADPAATAFEGYADPDERDVRLAEFRRVADIARGRVKTWPADIYSRPFERQEWRCFGPGSPTAGALVARATQRINDAPAGSRERTLLRGARLIPRRYSLDEYLEDRHGSRKTIETLSERGCLILVDEFALLHPRLREVAHLLLGGNRAAVVAITPCDPVHAATAKLLGQFSSFQVGTLVSRFRVQQDPRCELALNSVERVERWLRFIVPELVAGIDELESDPGLVARAHQLLD
jgi:hypothetical protein